MKLYIRYTIFLVMLSYTVMAQQESVYAIKIDSLIHNKWEPTGVRFGVDIAGPIYNAFEPRISNYEAMADIDFHKFFAVIELGSGAYDSSGDSTNYSNSGTFFRIGADVNMTAKDANLNVLYFGLRYATSSFSEKLKGELASSGWGSSPIDVEQNSTTTNWIEMNMGMRVRIYESLFMGYTLRFKLFKHNAFNESKFEPYFIPGYGVASNTSNWGISYYIQYRIAWKKKPIPWKAD